MTEGVTRWPHTGRARPCDNPRSLIPRRLVSATCCWLPVDGKDSRRETVSRTSVSPASRSSVGISGSISTLPTHVASPSEALESVSAAAIAARNDLIAGGLAPEDVVGTFNTRDILATRDRRKGGMCSGQYKLHSSRTLRLPDPMHQLRTEHALRLLTSRQHPATCGTPDSRPGTQHVAPAGRCRAPGIRCARSFARRTESTNCPHAAPRKHNESPCEGRSTAGPRHAERWQVGRIPSRDSLMAPHPVRFCLQ